MWLPRMRSFSGAFPHLPPPQHLQMALELGRWNPELPTLHSTQSSAHLCWWSFILHISLTLTADLMEGKGHRAVSALAARHWPRRANIFLVHMCPSTRLTKDRIELMSWANGTRLGTSVPLFLPGVTGVWALDCVLLHRLAVLISLTWRESLTKFSFLEERSEKSNINKK